MTKGDEMTNGTMVKLSTLVPGDTFTATDGDKILRQTPSGGGYAWTRLTDGADGGTTDGNAMVLKTNLKYTSV